jgi:hypothetical protein
MLEVVAMLYVGVDRAEAQHAACLLDAAEAVVRRPAAPTSTSEAGPPSC